MLVCVNCVEMNTEDGQIENEYDFAEDALEFVTQLAEAKDVTYTQPLSNPLAIGSHIVCTGTPSDDLPWFAINIGSGAIETGKANISVHFNVRMPQHYVVRNTRKNGRWGSEETTAFRTFPFKLDRPFTIEVVIDEKESLWAIDGQHYCSFAHRTPSPFNATWVEVAGVRDATLSVQNTDVYPVLALPTEEVPVRASYDAAAQGPEPTWRPHVLASLANGLPQGYQLVVRGRLRPILHSFLIDLVDACRDWPHANIHVHVNSRAHDESTQSRQLVVLNAWFGAWGDERRQRSATLIPGTTVTFRIVRGPGEWSVFADDILIGELEYRANPDGVRGVRLRGDLYPIAMYICPSSSTPISS